MEFLSALAAISALVLSVYLILRTTRNGKSRRATAPEATGAWPIIGHLHLLRDSELRGKFLGEMVDKVGPIFRLKLGSIEVVVISDREMAKECFSGNNDVVFASRHKSLAAELMCYNYAVFGFSPYGPYWRELHKIVTLELLSIRRIELLRHIRESEVKASIRQIYDLWDQNKKRASGTDKVLVEMKKLFENLTSNIILRMVIGKRYSSGEKEEEEGLRFRKAMRDFMELIGVFSLSDALPYLRWLDLGGHGKAMRRTGKEMDNILETWLNEHKQKRVSDKVKGEQEDFIDVMLSVLDHGDPTTGNSLGYDVDTITKSTCLAVFAASHSMGNRLFWVLAYLMNHPHALEKTQEELDIQVGKERQVEVLDTNHLVYLQAVIKETLRLNPDGAFGLPHESMEDCIVGGYHVPKGTLLMVNSGRIHRDPRVWSDPDEFRPERFLTTHKHVDFRGQQHEFIPFGSGRRSCPGISLSLQVMQFTIASLLHSFKFETTLSNDERIDDTSQGLGQFNLEAITSLELFATPRLSSTLY